MNFLYQICRTCSIFNTYIDVRHVFINDFVIIVKGDGVPDRDLYIEELKAQSMATTFLLCVFF